MVLAVDRDKTLPSPARIAAFEILLKVESGGYASDLLLTRTAPLDSRDAGLASEIVFGVLRYRAQLDLPDRTLLRPPPEARPAKCASRLRMGIYQLRYLDRIPAARRRRGKRRSGQARAQDARPWAS